MFFRFYTALFRYPLLLLSVLFALAIYLGSFIPNLQIDASSDTLVLEGDKSVEAYRKVYKEYGAGSFLFVTLRADSDVFSDKVQHTVARLKQDLSAVNGVRSVVTYLDVPLLNSPPVTLANLSEGVSYLTDADIPLDLARKEFQQSPLYRDLLTSQDEQVTALLVNLSFDEEVGNLRQAVEALKQQKSLNAGQQQALKQLEQSFEQAKDQRKQLEKQVVADVRAVLQSYRAEGNRIFLGGVPMIVSDMLDYVRNDMIVFGALVIVFIIVLLSALFRSWRWIILSLLTCSLTCVYMLGGLALGGFKLNVVSANFVALLLILNLSVVIHLAIRCIEYEKSEAAELSQFDLVMKTMRFMMKPCFYTTITTMAAFVSLMASGVKPVMDFGWTMAVAVTVGLIMSFLFLPAGLMLFSRTLRPKENKVSSQFTLYLAGIIMRRGRWLTYASWGLFIFALAGIAQLKVENRFIDYFDEETEIYQGMLEIDKELGGTLPLDIVLTKTDAGQTQFSFTASTQTDEQDDFFADEDDDDFAHQGEAEAISYWFTRQGMQEIQQVQQFLESMPETGKVLSLATLYQVLDGLVGGNLDDIQLALMKKNLREDMEKALVKPYLSSDGLQTRITLRVKETSKTLNRNEMLKSIDAFLQQQGYQLEEYQLTGMMVLYNNMLQSLFRSQAATLGMVFFAVWIMMGILYRSMVISFYALVPNVLAAAFVLGVMGWLNIPLDVVTITIGSITIGIGVDDTIHYIHRFKKELAVDGDYVKAMQRSHGSIGLAMFYTSVVIIVGFGVLTFSNFIPSIYFGFLTAIAMITALFGALLLLPHLLISFKPQHLLRVS